MFIRQASSLLRRSLYLVWNIGKIPQTAFTAAILPSYQLPLSNLLTGNFKPLVLPSSSSSSYTRDSQRMFTLKNDPQCGLTAGGTGCALDCDRILKHGRLIYRDPACLFDCENYPMCVQQLFEDYQDQGRVGSYEKKGNLYN